jgi:hypothetical protein
VPITAPKVLLVNVCVPVVVTTVASTPMSPVALSVTGAVALTATVPAASGKIISLSAVTVVACSLTSKSSGDVPSKINLVP